jgi:hypothetical protein
VSLLLKEVQRRERKEKEGKGDVDVIEATLVVLINKEDKLSEHMQTKQNTERT